MDQETFFCCKLKTFYGIFVLVHLLHTTILGATGYSMAVSGTADKAIKLICMLLGFGTIGTGLLGIFAVFKGRVKLLFPHFIGNFVIGAVNLIQIITTIAYLGRATSDESAAALVEQGNISKHDAKNQVQGSKGRYVALIIFFAINICLVIAYYLLLHRRCKRIMTQEEGGGSADPQPEMPPPEPPAPVAPLAPVAGVEVKPAEGEEAAKPAGEGSKRDEGAKGEDGKPADEAAKAEDAKAADEAAAKGGEDGAKPAGSAEVAKDAAEGGKEAGEAAKEEGTKRAAGAEAAKGAAEGAKRPGEAKGTGEGGKKAGAEDGAKGAAEENKRAGAGEAAAKGAAEGGKKAGAGEAAKGAAPAPTAPLTTVGDGKGKGKRLGVWLGNEYESKAG